jgi:hydrogen peroxide-dependent heme synthase
MSAQVPETLEGWSVLHQLFHVRWDRVRTLPPVALAEVARDAVARLTPTVERGATAMAQMLGHKADLMLLHFREDFEALAHVQQALAQTILAEYLEPATSFVSLVELGMYEMTAKLHEQLTAKGLRQGTEEFDRALAAEMETQRTRVMGRLFTEIPRRRHVCFYPMNKRRGEAKNWYSAPFDDRAAMMREHGIIGRHYSGQVTQIISGAIGLDDWEWGVDLFADDPLVFKKLIYELRFDRASADYAEFGPFYVGLQFDSTQLDVFLGGGVAEMGAGGRLPIP